MKRVLTIAGSDSGGGAGIQADLKTITVLGAFGTSALTALTVQDTTGVKGILPVPPDFVRRQVEAVLTDIGADAIKTGMLVSAAGVEAVTDALGRFPAIPLVVDPVGIAKGGVVLLDGPGRDVLRRRLLSLALVVTPNLPEAADLSGRPVETLDDMREAARRIRDLGPQWVLVKGGHLAGDPVDVLLGDDGFREFPGPRLPGRNTHGTGCTLSAGIATFLALGLPVPEAVAAARGFVVRAIEACVALGAGHGSLGHLAASTGSR
jgi:hydroxymethylpyrimidine kinase/phosphomethylpyrimidine kinase